MPAPSRHLVKCLIVHLTKEMQIYGTDVVLFFFSLSLSLFLSFFLSFFLPRVLSLGLVPFSGAEVRKEVEDCVYEGNAMLPRYVTLAHCSQGG